MILSGIAFVGCFIPPLLQVADFKKHMMPWAITSAVVFFAGFLVTVVADKVTAFRNEQISKLWEETGYLAAQGKYVAAAEIFTRHALKEIKRNELFFCLYCRNASEMWVMAREPDKALQEARNILQVYVKNNGKWLKFNTGKYVEDLTKLVNHFLAAGYNAEGAMFAGEVNQHLESFGFPMHCAAVPVGKNIFPKSCSICGAVLSSNPYQDVAQCDYCKAIIYPLNHPPQVKESNAAPPAKFNTLHPAYVAANNLVKAENRINLPPPNPMVKGAPQMFYSNLVAFTVPSNWKRTPSNYLAADDFFSPDKRFKLSLSVLTVRDKEADMLHEFRKIIAADPDAKVSLKALGVGTLGIFSFSGGRTMNSISWESFVPPNSGGATEVLGITMFFPAGEFERHMQLISDIFGSIKIIK
jgi:hypothetical protein